MKSFYICIIIVLFAQIPYYLAKSNSKHAIIDNIVDIKDFKKVLRTKTNVLVCFTSTGKQTAIMKVFKDTAVSVKGLGTMMLVDCSGEAKKMCKKLKVSPSPYVLKHYKDGEFNKDYDRLETVASMVNFMRDPVGDIPWEEDKSASNVYHVPDAITLAKFLKRETKPIMIMFYAPWCGFCKTMKPEYSNAADELNGESVLAAIDVNRPENSVIRNQYNITGFPTLLYYENGVLKYTYEGDNNKGGIVSFMRNPQPAPVKLVEADWSDTDSEVVHLTSASFDPVLKEEASVLVMFYAPWCGHCKKMKPEYETAAAQLKANGISGMLAAVDATKEPTVAAQYTVKGYPTVKYFSYGEEKYDVKVRDAPQLVAFMRSPEEPAAPPPPDKPWGEEEGCHVVHLNEESFKPFLKKKKHVLVMFYTPWCAYCKSTKPHFSKAAKHFKDDPKVEFAAVDCTTEKALCGANGVQGYPTIKYFSYYSKTTKSYKGERTETEFIQFMSDPDGAANPPNVSKPPPTPKDDWVVSSSVLQLTDNTFKREIQSKDAVLVMFYAPWCGHCKKMKPEYALAAEALLEEGVGGHLAMVDCTSNPEITEEYEISGFPTLKLFKDGKYIRDYTGKRTVDDLKEFMKQAKKMKKDEL